MKFAIIGAGVAGLASARRCLENGYEVLVYERSKGVGGTWVYDERIGLDEFGLPIHTSMYKNLMTNLPKELMDFPNWPYKYLEDVSFLKSCQVQEYIEQFTDHFGLKKHIRFCSLVTSVERLGNTWQVTSEDLPTKTLITEYYDAVLVCNGHNASPFIPNIPGMDEFNGIQIHSHDYRVPEHYKNMNVLIIGAGPSGVDICKDVANVAKQVYFSHHRPKFSEKEFPNNVLQKPDIEFLSQKSVSFKDKTIVDTLDVIIYCTGFKIAIPFLKSSCGIHQVNDKLITPLHKNIINMNNPTMGFIGFINMTFIHRIFDLQIRYYLEFLRIKHASKEDWMIAVNTHYLGKSMFDYCKSLSLEEIKVESIPLIFFKVYEGCHKLKEKNCNSYRSAIFTIVDNDNCLIKFDDNNEI